jgi:hypothetical protein
MDTVAQPVPIGWRLGEHAANADGPEDLSRVKVVGINRSSSVVTTESRCPSRQANSTVGSSCCWQTYRVTTQLESRTANGAPRVQSARIPFRLPSRTSGTA